MTVKKQKVDPKVRELQQRLRALRTRQGELRKTGVVPTKKQSKPLPYKMQDTFKENLKGVPGGGIVGMIGAAKTGTRVRREGAIGLLRSARNANTTQGYYNRIEEVGATVVDAQGRRTFGR